METMPRNLMNSMPELPHQEEKVVHGEESTPPTEYRLLVGHLRGDKKTYVTDDQLRTEYLQLTDDLIHKMTNGVEVTDPVTKELSTQIPDYVVFLDKSARPVEWLVHDMWPRFAGDPAHSEKPLPKMPEVRFVNIDRDQWVNTLDPLGSGFMDINRVDKSIVRSLRSIFINPKHKKDGLTESLDTAPAQLDNKTILIVDETMTTGRTLRIAQQFFEKAFPTARIAATYWMGGISSPDGLARTNYDIPVWYKEKVEAGRGVANRDHYLSEKSSNITQRLGAYFLSTRLLEKDELSLELRQELKQLATDPSVLVVPSFDRDIEDQASRAELLNHVSFSEYKDRKKEIGAQTR